MDHLQLATNLLTFSEIERLGRDIAKKPTPRIVTGTVVSGGRVVRYKSWLHPFFGCTKIKLIHDGS